MIVLNIKKRLSDANQYKKKQSVKNEKWNDVFYQIQRQHKSNN